MSLRTSLIIDLAGNLATRARQYARELGGLSAAGQRHMRALSGVAASAGRGIDAMGNRYTGFVTGVGASLMVRKVADSQLRMVRLGITANTSRAKIGELKKEIYEVAQAPDVRVDPSQITSAVESIMEKTGDLKFAQENIRNIGLALQATGAEGGAIGDIFSEFQKQGIKAPEQVLRAIDTLNEQGKEGAFTLANLAALGPRVVTAYTALGRSGVGAMKEMGAVLQVIRQGTGSSEQAATAWEAMLRTFSDKAKVKALGKHGVQVFDPAELKKGREVLRPANELMLDILKAARNKATNLSTVFDAEAIRAFNAVLGEIQRNGSPESLNRLLQVSGDGASLIRDSAEAADTASAAMTNLRTAWGQFADSKLTEPIQKAADLLNTLGSDDSQKLLDYASKGVMAVGGLVLARKGYGAYRGLRDMFGKGTSGASPTGAAGLAGVRLPLPVYIVNSQMSLLPGQLGGTPDRPAGGAGKGTGGTPAPRGGRWAKWAGRSTAMVAAVPMIVEGARVLMDETATTKQKGEALGAAAGGTAGGWGGAALGAAIGTAILPGIGTAVGGALGGALAAWGGSELGRWLGGKVAGDPEGDAEAIGEAVGRRLQAAHSKTEIAVKVEGPATAAVANHSGPADVDVYSGQGWGAWF